MTDLSSIDLDLLSQFIAAGEVASHRVDLTHAGLEKLQIDVRAASTSGAPSEGSMAAAAELFAMWVTNQERAQTIKENLADLGSGLINYDSNDLGLTLALAPSNARPAVVDVVESEVLGLVPTSGFADDPICTANGNFVQIDTDLHTPGAARCIDLVRTYNSRAAGTGLFGTGWSSLLDSRLHVSTPGGAVMVTLADGGIVRFQPTDTGTFHYDGRRNLRLERSDPGWSLRGDGSWWDFDDEGQLVGGGFPDARFEIEQQPHEIVAHERRSGRSTTFSLDEGLIVEARSSDGRTVTFDYEETRCVGATGDVGDMRYRYDEGLLAEVVDADGVRLCRNTFDEDGRVLEQVNEFGRSSNFEYADQVTRVSYGDDGLVNVFIHDDRFNLTALFGADGIAMNTTWDERDRPTTLRDRNGSQIVLEYVDDPQRNLLARRVTDGEEERWTYDDRGRPISHTNRAGATTTFGYDGEVDQPTTVVNALDAVTRLAWTETGELSEIIDADGVTNNFDYNRDGLLATVASPLGHRVSYTYDPRCQLTRLVDATGAVTDVERDPAGRPVRLTKDDGPVIERRYSPAGRVRAVAVDGSERWRATYGDHGRMVTFGDAAGAETTFHYDDFGYVSAVETADGQTVSYQRDALGGVVAIVDGQGNTSRQDLDRSGHWVSVTDVHGARTMRTVDYAGRTKTLVLADGASWAFTYHPSGQIASTTTPEGNTTTFDYDDAARLTTQTAPDGSEVDFRYSVAGRLLQRTTTQGRSHQYRYDEAGLLRSVTDADGQTITASRRADGRVTSLGSEPSAVHFLHGASGQLAGWHHGQKPGGLQVATGSSGCNYRLSGGEVAQLLTDSQGLLAQAIDPAGVLTSFDHDAGGRCTLQSTQGHTWRYEYGPVGQLASAVDPLGMESRFDTTPAGRRVGVGVGSRPPLRFAHDERGRVISVVDEAAGELAAFEYHPQGEVTKASNGNGVVEMSHDHRGAIVETRSFAGPPVVYRWDNDGLLLERIEHEGTGYRYLRSKAGRIEAIVDAEMGTVPAPTTAVSDESNLAGRAVADRHGRSFHYDQAGRLVSASTADGLISRFAYNEVGLLSEEETPEGGRRSFRYNEAGQLVQISESTTGRTMQFRYNEFGQRVEQRANDGTATIYCWNPLGHLVTVEQRDAAGRSTTRTIAYSALGRPERIDDQVIGWDDGMSGKPVRIGQRRFLRLAGSVCPVGEAAEWDDGSRDDPWGWVPASSLDLGFRGELAMDGLVFMGARVYDPSTRCFLSRDPLPPVPGQVGYAGPYIYAWNDPVNYLDPSGRRPLSVEEFDARRRDIEEASAPGIVRTVDGMMPWDVSVYDIGDGIGAAATALYRPVAVSSFQLAFGHPIPREFIEHYAYGNGQPVHLDPDQMVDLAVYADVRRSPEANLIIDDLDAIGGGTVDVEFQGWGGAATNGTLGNFNIDWDGELSVNPNDHGGYDWSFDGEMDFTDVYDFNASTHRPDGAELMTTIGRTFLPGEPFEITSDTVAVSQSGNQSQPGIDEDYSGEADWEGTDEEGKLNRISGEENEENAEFDENEGAADFGETDESKDDEGGPTGW